VKLRLVYRYGVSRAFPQLLVRHVKVRPLVVEAAFADPRQVRRSATAESNRPEETAEKVHTRRDGSRQQHRPFETETVVIEPGHVAPEKLLAVHRHDQVRIDGRNLELGFATILHDDGDEIANLDSTEVERRRGRIHPLDPMHCGAARRGCYRHDQYGNENRSRWAHRSRMRDGRENRLRVEFCSCPVGPPK
jgi:hypothetical protein